MEDTLLYNRFRDSETRSPLFLGDSLGMQEYVTLHYPGIHRLTEKQKDFMWRAEEVNLSLDATQMLSVSQDIKEISHLNLSFQIVGDSIQSRGTVLALLPFVSTPELEAAIIWWSAFEQIHSYAYTYIIRNNYPNPKEVLSEIRSNGDIIKRTSGFTKYYDRLFMIAPKYKSGQCTNEEIQQIREDIYLALVTSLALEGIAFHVSFACNFIMTQNNLFPGVTNIMKLILRDERLHLGIAYTLVKMITSGKQGSEWLTAIDNSRDEAMHIINAVVAQEISQSELLFKDRSIVGLNANLLTQFTYFNATNICRNLRLPFEHTVRKSPLPWFDSYIDNKSLNPAPQEDDITDYRISSIDTNLSSDKLTILKGKYFQ